MEQTKVNPVIECFVSHGPINQLSFFYVLYEKKSVGQKSLWIFAPRSKTNKRREQKQHYALLRSQQLLRCFLDMRLVTVQPSKELQL